MKKYIILCENTIDADKASLSKPMDTRGEDLTFVQVFFPTDLLLEKQFHEAILSMYFKDLL